MACSSCIGLLGLAGRSALVISPHPDDAELACAGTMIRLLTWGVRVDHLRLTMRGVGTLEQEAAAADAIFGDVAPGLYRTSWLDLPHRGLGDHAVRAQLRQHLYEVRLDYDVVFIPSSADTHEDHEAVRDEALRVFRRPTVLGYECPWNNGGRFRPQLYVRLVYEDVAGKLEAVECYKSQQGRGYVERTAVRTQLVFRRNEVLPPWVLPPPDDEPDEAFSVEGVEAFEVFRGVL